MRTVRAWWSRLGGLLRPSRGEREFTEELQSHIDFQIADNLRAGMTPEEARLVAATLMTVALLAAVIPAARVLRVDPITTLRCE